tara:strand:- start:831 stop:3068 length:2238 start_codon:yes stop_codon:yes gene_type:complete
MNDKIFVSIVAFMDPLLELTVRNMLHTAKEPDKITFGIVNQDTLENTTLFAAKYCTENFKIINVLPTESQGCCWARAKAQSLITDEMYFMQTDSHHNYVKHWDFLCKLVLSQCAALSLHENVILSTYATPAVLSPKFQITHGDAPYYMKCERFYDIPKVRYVPTRITEITSQEPILWHTISAHFIFTYIQWVKDVPYDPELYFDGEEDTLALRSYTRGYDMYYPYIKISYHYYTRENSRRHCDVNEDWHVLNTKSIQRLNDIIKGKVKGLFGLGNVRTMDEYTEFSLVDYVNQAIYVPEIYYFGEKKFTKTGFTWKNDGKSYKELESMTEFFLLYDILLKQYVKLNKFKCTLSTSNDLVKWDLIGPDNNDKVFLVYGEKVFTQCLKTKAWTEKSIKNDFVWEFNHVETTNLCYIIRDSIRDMTLRLHKDLTCYEAMWPPENKYVSLYGTPKTSMLVEPKSLTPKPKEPYAVLFGYSTFCKEDSESFIWTEHCSQKNIRYILKELLNNLQYYIMIDNERKLMYKLHKDLSKLEIQTHENCWTSLYINGTKKQYEIANVDEMEEIKTFSINRNSPFTIVCIGSSNVPYFQEMKKNHIRYAKYYKYNYFYYDKDCKYDAEILKKHTTQIKYLLKISTKCIFTMFVPIISIGKYIDANVIVSSIDDNVIQTHMILFKFVMHGTSTFFNYFDENVLISDILDGVKVIDNSKLATRLSNHHKKCNTLCMHLSDAAEIHKHFLKWNTRLNIQ